MNKPAAYRLRSTGAPRWAGLLLFAIFLRAMVPAGFMPAAFAAGHPALPIAVCSQGMPAGFQPLQGVDHAPAGPVDQVVQHCVFSAVAMGAAPVPATGLVVSAALVIGSVLPRAALVSLACSSCGPPLGSRAPPAFTFI